MSTQLARTAEPIDYMGMQAVFRVTKEMSGGTYQAFENITPPGTGVPLHTHPTDDETLFVEQGRLTCVLGARRFVAETGDCVRLPAGTPHAWSALGDETAVVLVVARLRSDGDFERMFRALSPLTPEDFEAATGICEANAIGLTWPLVMRRSIVRRETSPALHPRAPRSEQGTGPPARPAPPPSCPAGGIGNVGAAPQRSGARLPRPSADTEPDSVRRPSSLPG